VDERVRHEIWSGFQMGVDIIDPVTFEKRQNKANNWMQDRARMRAGETFTGIRGVNVEDIAVEESMGPIYDRTKEHLGTSDVAVIRMRRLMIDSARELVANGTPPVGLREPVDYSKLTADEGMLPIDAPWEPVLSTYGDVVEAG
jgi:phthalate 4,5-dioxygenase oxygenase subunit